MEAPVQLRQPRAHTHEAAEALEGARDARVRVDLDENILLGLDVDLQQSSLVEWAVQQRQQTLAGRAPQPRGSGWVEHERHAKNQTLRLAALSVWFVNGTWWVMSGRQSAMSRLFLRRMFWWSSQLSSSYEPALPTLVVSSVAFCSTTINRRCESRSCTQRRRRRTEGRQAEGTTGMKTGGGDNGDEDRQRGRRG